MYFCFVCCDLSISFLVWLIWIFSLCFLMSLANGLPILFILSKDQFLALLIMVCFVLFTFISARFLKIYFLLLTLGFFISSFSSCFRCRVRLFSWLFFLFLEVSLCCYEPSPWHCLAVSERFWVVVFSFSFVPMHIWFPFWFLLRSVGYSEACCLASICLFFIVFLFQQMQRQPLTKFNTHLW